MSIPRCSACGVAAQYRPSDDPEASPSTWVHPTSTTCLTPNVEPPAVLDADVERGRRIADFIGEWIFRIAFTVIVGGILLAVLYAAGKDDSSPPGEDGCTSRETCY